MYVSKHVHIIAFVCVVGEQLSINGNSKKGCVRGVLRYPAQLYASKRLNKKEIYENRYKKSLLQLVLQQNQQSSLLLLLLLLKQW